MWRIITFSFDSNTFSGVFGIKVDNSGVTIKDVTTNEPIYENISGDSVYSLDALDVNKLIFYNTNDNTDPNRKIGVLSNFPAAIENETITETTPDGTWSYVNSEGFVISVSSGENGNIYPSDVEVPAGANKTFQIAPDSGYEVSSVLVDGVDVKQDLVNNTYTFTNIQSNHTISVSFEESLIITTRTRTVTYSKSGKGGLTPYTTFTINVDQFGHPYTETYQHISGGSGSFTRAEYNASTDLFDLYSRGETLYMHNFSVALPNQSYLEGSDEWIYDLSVSTKYTITPSAAGSGSISPDVPTLVDEGQDQSFTITPDDGYYITSVLVDSVESISELVDNTYTFTNVNDVHTIEVTFCDEPPTPPEPPIPPFKGYGFNRTNMIDIDYLNEIGIRFNR